VAPINEIKLQV